MYAIYGSICNGANHWFNKNWLQFQKCPHLIIQKLSSDQIWLVYFCLSEPNLKETKHNRRPCKQEKFALFNSFNWFWWKTQLLLYNFYLPGLSYFQDLHSKAKVGTWSPSDFGKLFEPSWKHNGSFCMIFPIKYERFWASKSLKYDWIATYWIIP
jgi:hypothetical protein